MNIVIDKTRKGEKYTIIDDRYILVGYSYNWCKRYFIKHPDEIRFRPVTASVLWKIFPAGFRELRERMCIRNYTR